MVEAAEEEDEPVLRGPLNVVPISETSPLTVDMADDDAADMCCCADVNASDPFCCAAWIELSRVVVALRNMEEKNEDVGLLGDEGEGELRCALPPDVPAPPDGGVVVPGTLAEVDAGVCRVDLEGEEADGPFERGELVVGVGVTEESPMRKNSA